MMGHLWVNSVIPVPQLLANVHNNGQNPDEHVRKVKKQVECIEYVVRILRVVIHSTERPLNHQLCIVQNEAQEHT